MNEAEIIKNLTIGSSREVMANSPSSPLAKILQDEANNIVSLLQASMYKYDIDASNNLISTTTPTEINITGNTIEIGISSQFYWKFLNYGVNGTLVNRGAPNWGTQPNNGSMSDALKSWEISRGIKTVNGVYNWTSLSKVEGMTLIERGQKARPFFTDVVNVALVDSLTDKVSALMKRSIEIIIREPIWQ